MNIWYSYDPEDGYTTHETPEDAREAAEASLEYHRDRSTDGWHENTSDIEWGLLVPYGEARECNRVETPGGEFDCICDYQIVSAPGDDPLEEACRRLERSTDWYQQRFTALRKWVKEEVEPLSSEVAHRYFAIVANGSPSSHESADWQDTIHGLTLRAERAEQERDEARVGIERVQTLVAALRDERDAIRQAVEGQGVGLTALQILLGSPKEGLIEAARKLVVDRDEARAEVERLRNAHREEDVLVGVRTALTAMADAYDLRGVSAGKLAEMLGYPVHQLHDAGLQLVANAIYEGAMADPEKSEQELRRTVEIVEQRVGRERDEARAEAAELRRKLESMQAELDCAKAFHAVAVKEYDLARRSARR